MYFQVSDPFCKMKTEYLWFQMLDEIDLLIKPSQIVMANKLKANWKQCCIRTQRSKNNFNSTKTIRKNQIFLTCYMLICCNRMKVL